MITRRSRQAAQLAAMVAMLVALAAPSGAQAFSKAIWGEAYHNGVNQFPLYKQLGVKIVEHDLGWSTVAPKRPKSPADPHDRAYIWPNDVQQLVTQAKRYHTQVMLQIITAPPWANGGHSAYWAPRPSAYAAFAAAAAKHYPDVHLWMVWGEPSREPRFQPLTPAKPGQALDAAQKIAPHNYARILDAAYGALKLASKRNTVIGGGPYTTGDIDTQQWIENLRLPNGKPPRMDVYAQNPFTDRDPTFSKPYSTLGYVKFSDLPEVATWTDRYLRKGMPIFLSEWTIPTAADQEFTFYVDPQTAAQWVREALQECRRWKRIYGLGWIHVYDQPPYSYGGLITAQGVHKPVFDAFAHG